MSKNINFFILLRGSMYPEFQCIVICQKRLVLFNQQPITLTLLRSKISFLFTMILNLYSRVTTLLFIFLYIYRMCFYFFSLFSSFNWDVMSKKTNVAGYWNTLLIVMRLPFIIKWKVVIFHLTLSDLNFYKVLTKSQINGFYASEA